MTRRFAIRTRRNRDRLEHETSGTMSSLLSEMLHPRNLSPQSWLYMAGLSWLVVFFLESWTPLGVAHGFLYLLPLMAAAAAGRVGPLVILTGASAAATVLGVFLSPSALDPRWALLNRGVSILMMIAFSALACLLLAEVRRHHERGVEVRKSVAALARAETVLQHAERTGPIGSFQVNVLTGNLRVSDGFRRILGLSSGEPASLEEVACRLSPEEQDAFDTCMRDTARNGDHLEREFRLKRANDNAERQVIIIVERLESDGEIFRAGIVQDITDQHTRERRLRLLSSAVSMLDEIVLITEAEPLDAPDGPRIVYVNEAFERITGFSREQAIGNTPRILQGPRTQRSALARLRAAFEAVEPVTVELINYTREGREYWHELSISPVLDDRGRVTHFVAVQRDVTARKRDELALREAEERYRLIAKATKDVVWEWDLRTGEVWHNDSLEAVLGRRVGSVDEWRALVHPDDRARVGAVIAHMLENPDTVMEDEYRISRADGTYIRVLARAFVQRNAEGDAIRMLGTTRDVTEARRMEERLRRSETLQAVGTLTGGIAHDVNNLMTVVLGHADLLDEELENAPKLHKHVEQIGTAAERAAALTGRLLSIAREQPLDPRAVDVTTLLERLQPILRSTLPENIDLQMRIGRDVPPAHVDPGQLEVALLNLVINARDALDRGGRVEIELSLERSAAPDEPDDGAPLPEECVVIAVRDDGAGMSDEVLAKALDPFFTTKPKGMGTGLGLPMVHGFARQSGGDLKLASEPGKGTEVRVLLPASHRDAAPDPETATSLERSGGDHILLVEDSPDVRRTIKQQLEALGHSVTAVSDAGQAMAYLEGGRDVALLITDLVLPGPMNGAELTRKAKTELPSIAVLHISGYAEDAVLPHDRSDYETPLLQKPFRRDKLAAAVRSAIDG